MQIFLTRVWPEPIFFWPEGDPRNFSFDPKKNQKTRDPTRAKSKNPKPDPRREKLTRPTPTNYLIILFFWKCWRNFWEILGIFTNKYTFLLFFANNWIFFSLLHKKWKVQINAKYSAHSRQTFGGPNQVYLISSEFLHYRPWLVLKKVLRGADLRSGKPIYNTRLRFKI